MATEAIDFANLALSRLAQQYRDKDKYVALVTGLCGFAQSQIDDPLEYLFTLYDIDTAEGSNLDIIGEIVGQDRVLADYDLFEFFGYDGATSAGTYGDVTDPNVGARYLSETESIGGDKTLSDPEYRTFIRARILRNYSTSTPEAIIEAVKLVLNIEFVRYEESSMSIDLEVFGTVDANDAALLQTYDLLPRPTGVDIASITITPGVVTASGAGESSVNSDYTIDGVQTDRPTFSNEAGVSIEFASGAWKIFSAADVELYENTSTADYPPKTGWTVVLGASPAPTLSY